MFKYKIKQPSPMSHYNDYVVKFINHPLRNVIDCEKLLG